LWHPPTNIEQPAAVVAVGSSRCGRLMRRGQRVRSERCSYLGDEAAKGKMNESANE